MHKNIHEIDGHFYLVESNAFWPGQRMSIEVQLPIVHHEQSLYQDVLIVDTVSYGRVLVLDGVIQCTERDEFAYQEMIAHLPLSAHPNPRRVLVIGGGDGGVLREVVKHPSVESVTLCEIDEAVPRVSKAYLPYMAVGFDHPAVSVVIQDGFEFLKDKVNEYDVVITDSSDPVGPASSLFQASFFELIQKALKPGGILCSQGECVWLHLDLIQSILMRMHLVYPRLAYAYTCIPTYPSGQIGFILASKDANVKLEEPARTLPEKAQTSLHYYSPAMHRAAFALPEFARRVIQPILNGEAE